MFGIYYLFGAAVAQSIDGLGWTTVWSGTGVWRGVSTPPGHCQGALEQTKPNQTPNDGAPTV